MGVDEELQMAYRKAKCIELHEAHTAITTSAEAYARSAAAGRSVLASRPAFFARWSDVVNLARRAGLTLPGSSSQQGQIAPNSAADIPMFRAYYETPANTPGLTITGLECDVQNPNLVEIRVTSRVEGSAPETPDDVEIITHSGSFTIWWAADQPVDTQLMTAVAEAHPPIPVEDETDITQAIGTKIEMDIPNGEE